MMRMQPKNSTAHRIMAAAWMRKLLPERAAHSLSARQPTDVPPRNAPALAASFHSVLLSNVLLRFFASLRMTSPQRQPVRKTPKTHGFRESGREEGRSWRNWRKRGLRDGLWRECCTGRGREDRTWSEAFRPWHGHDGVCLTTVRRAEGVAKREELAVKRPVPPRFRLLTEGPPLLPAGLDGCAVVVNLFICNTLALNMLRAALEAYNR